MYLNKYLAPPPKKIKDLKKNVNVKCYQDGKSKQMTTFQNL